MKKKLIITVALSISFGYNSLAQDRPSRADMLFYEYAYSEAIEEYKKETVRAPLKLLQIRNLAEAYEKTGNEEEALNLYQDLFQRDSNLTQYHLNRMLNLLLRARGTEGVVKFMNEHPDAFSEEVMENAAFNYELANQPVEEDSKFQVFAIEANSSKADFAPTFYGDEILFTSSRNQESKETYSPTGDAYMDIFIGKVQVNGDVSEVKPFDGTQDSRFHEATPFYSEVIDQVFYIRSNERNGRLSFDQNGKNALAIGVSDANQGFRFLLRDLSTSFYYPFFDDSSQRLYFAANLEGGYGGTDLYYVHTNNGQIMSAPVNLGPRINTPGNEISPYISGNSIYFASDIFYGFGGMDVYKSDISPGEFYSIPINLGPSLNTEKDEFGFIIRSADEAGLMGYYSSNREDGKGKDDIYGFRVKKKPGPKSLVLKGRVVMLDSDVGIPGAIVRLQGENGELLKEVTSDESGAYQIEVPWQKEITLGCDKLKYSLFRRIYNEKSLEEFEGRDVNIGLVFLEDIVEEREDQTVLKLKKFWFDRGRTDLTAEIETELDKVVEAIKMFPELQLRIEAHTDSRGGSAANFKLSQERADVIKQYLLSNGVPPTNILYTIGYGEDKILNSCTNGVYCLDVLHKKNERHLIVILNYNLLY